MLVRAIPNPAATVPTLSYALQVNPDPLVALPVVGSDQPAPAPQFASLVLMITNNTSNNVNIDQITLLIPSAAGDSTPGVPSLTSEVPATAQISNTTDFGLSQPAVSTTYPGNVQCVITNNDSSVPFGPGDTLYLEVYDIEMDTYVGVLSFQALEVLSGGSINNPGVATMPVQKLPSGFYFDYLVVTAGDPPVPVSQVAYNTEVTLTWSSSIAQLATTTSFIVYYSTANGQQSVCLDSQIATWTSLPLTDDTVFTVVAVVDQADLSTTQYALTASVSVQQPDIVVGNVSATSLTATSSVTQSAATLSMMSVSGFQSLDAGTYTAPTDGLVFGVVNGTAAPVGTSYCVIIGSCGPVSAVATGGQVAYTDSGQIGSEAFGTSFLLPVPANNSFTLSITQSQNNVVNPSTSFYWIPFGTGQASAS